MPGAAQMSVFVAMVVGLVLPFAVLSVPWDLRDYDRTCTKTRLRGIRRDASGVTYSPVTNTIWVVARVPMGLYEYDINGEFLRRVDTGNIRFQDPEGEQGDRSARPLIQLRRYKLTTVPPPP